MKIGRTIASIVGLLGIALTYITGDILYLSIAVIAFIAGLYMMGANRRPVVNPKTEDAGPSKQHDTSMNRGSTKKEKKRS